MQPPDVTSNTGMAQTPEMHAHAQSVRVAGGVTGLDFTQGGIV